MVRYVLGILYRFESFVAARYLFVPMKKVTPLVRKMILVLFGVQTALIIALVAGVELGWMHLEPTLPLLWVIAANAIALLFTIVWGVLRHSKIATGALIAGIVLILLAIVMYRSILKGAFITETGEIPKWLLWTMGIIAVVGFLLAACSLFFGMLRAFFSFFTTVSIGGVFIGTAALIIVLSVMSGFESDLREKILGSNAHIQVSREDGDFTEWRDVKNRIDAIPGVVASTPYAMSEVVIAANSNGMNVIIKGIDPKTVGSVTELVKDLEPLGNPKEQAETLKRLEPLIADQHDLRVPVKPAPPKKPNAVDPAPDDMPTGGDPIDYTQPMEESAGSGSGSGSAVAPEPPPDYVPQDVVDPPPVDLITTEDPPLDLSQPATTAPDPTVHVVDMPPDQPALSRRTQTLPGILVGRELVKQTHLYTGEEVRVVSPLSDPSNPDATGTPIPFNRDYRVAGVFFTGMYEYDLKYVYVTLDSLNEFLDRGDSVDGIEVRVTSPDATGAYVDKIKAALGPQYRVQDWNDLNRSLFSALELEKIAMFLVLGIVILVASFSIVGNLIMIVVEKAREIALLKTLGGGDKSVMLVFVIQGLLIGVVGVLLGLYIGLLVCWLGKRLGFPLNPDVYYIDRMPFHVEPTAIAAIAAAGIFISLVATVYPALVAGQVRPAAGMRH